MVHKVVAAKSGTGNMEQDIGGRNGSLWCYM